MNRHHHSHTIAQHDIENSAKKLLADKEIEAVLRRLDCLTQEEGRITVAEIFEVVYGLINNVKVAMNGTQGLLCLTDDLQLRYDLCRWKCVNRWRPESSRYAFNALVGRCCTC